MSVVSVNYMLESYFGEDRVLLALDGGGVDDVRVALTEAGAASVDLTPIRVLLRIDAAKTSEMIDCPTTLSAPRGAERTAGHFYIDMLAPP